MVTKLNSRVSTEIIGLKIQRLAGVKVYNFRSQNNVFYSMTRFPDILVSNRDF